MIISREDIEEIDTYYLDVLSLEDAKELFNSIHKIEDEVLLEEILGYLDYHVFFVEKTALSIKKTLTPQMIRDKFKNGEFSQISVKRKQNFDKFLNEIFTLDRLDDEEILILKEFSALPSIEIEFEFLETIIQKKEDSEFEELLNFLSEKGWLIKLEGGYKLHQIIKEYLLANYTPNFEEIEVVVDSLNSLLENSADPQVAVNNRDNIIYFESLITFLEKLEIENEKIGTFFERFGNIYLHYGFYKKVEYFFKKAIEIKEKVLGKECPTTGISYNNLGGFYCLMEEYEKAEELYLKDLKISEKVLGKEHLNTLVSYNNLGGLYESMKMYEKAEQFYLKSLCIENNHPHISIFYNNLAGLYYTIGASQKSEKLYLKSLKINEKILGDNHPNTALSYHNHLAEFYSSNSMYGKSEKFSLKALKIREKIFGKDHPNTILSANNLALCYYKQGNFEKAHDYMENIVKICSKAFPEGHSYLLEAERDLKIIKAKL